MNSKAIEKKLLHELICIENRVDKLAYYVRVYCQSSNLYQQELPPFSLSSPYKRQILDENGCLMAVNDTWLRTMGYTQEHVIGKWFGDFLYQPDISIFANKLLCAREIGEIDMIVLRMMRKDGSIIVVTLKATISFDDYGIFRKIFCEFEDITEFMRCGTSLENTTDRIPLTAAMVTL